MRLLELYAQVGNGGDYTLSPKRPTVLVVQDVHPGLLNGFIVCFVASPYWTIVYYEEPAFVVVVVIDVHRSCAFLCFVRVVVLLCTL